MDELEKRIAALQARPPVWRLSDGRAGHDRQAAALAAGLGGESTVLEVRWPVLWCWLAPHFLPGLNRLCRALPKPAEGTLIIGCGRQSALANRWLKRRYGERVFTVQILDPRAARDEFDILIVPRHDVFARKGLHRENVLPMLGSLHPVDDAWLAAARRRWRKTFESLPEPRHLVLMGGGGKYDLRRLIAPAINEARRAGGSVMLSFSPRSPTQLTQLAQRMLASIPHYFYTGGDPNPYPGMLACAAHIYVAADSINMISEALAAGVPVTIAGRLPSPRHRRFVNSLCPKKESKTLQAKVGACKAQIGTAKIAEHVVSRWRRENNKIPHQLKNL